MTDQRGLIAGTIAAAARQRRERLAALPEVPIERQRDMYALALGSGRLITVAIGEARRVIVGTEPELLRHCGSGGRFMLGATLVPVPPGVSTLAATEWANAR
jgi:hypothetical protein